MKMLSVVFISNYVNGENNNDYVLSATNFLKTFTQFRWNEKINFTEQTQI